MSDENGIVYTHTHESILDGDEFTFEISDRISNEMVVRASRKIRSYTSGLQERAPIVEYHDALVRAVYDAGWIVSPTREEWKAIKFKPAHLIRWMGQLIDLHYAFLVRVPGE